MVVVLGVVIIRELFQKTDSISVRRREHVSRSVFNTNLIWYVRSSARFMWFRICLLSLQHCANDHSVLLFTNANSSGTSASAGRRHCHPNLRSTPTRGRAQVHEGRAPEGAKRHSIVVWDVSIWSSLLALCFAVSIITFLVFTYLAQRDSIVVWDVSIRHSSVALRIAVWIAMQSFFSHASGTAVMLFLHQCTVVVGHCVLCWTTLSMQISYFLWISHDYLSFVHGFTVFASMACTFSTYTRGLYIVLL